MGGPIFDIVSLVLAAFLGGFVARTLKFPPVVGYIAAGIIFGFVGKNFLSSYESLQVISEIGVSLLLFTLGFEFSTEKLRRINKAVFIAGILQVLLVVVVLFPVLSIFQLSIPVAILFAIIFAFSSTAVVVKILEERGQLTNYPGSQVFIFLLLQDLLVVPVILLMPLLFGDDFGAASVSSFLLSVAGAAIIFGGILVASKLFLSKLLNILFRYPTYELVLLASLFIAFVSIGLFTLIGLPQSIAAFLAGILISEQGKNLSPLSAVRPFRDVLLVLFFVLTGMLLDVQVLISILPLVIFLSIAVIFVKFLASFFVLRSASYLLFPAVFVAGYLANVGEFAVVIGQIAYQEKYIDLASYNLLLSIFIVSLVLLPLVVKYSNVAFEYFIERGWLKQGKTALESHRLATERAVLRGHVVICGHGRVGREVRHLLDDASIPYVVVDFDRNVYRQLVEGNKQAILGDPSDASVLEAAYVKNAKALVVAVPDGPSQKKIIASALSENPKITIICRSHEDKDKYDLLNLGANTIVVPEFEAGVRIGHAVLDSYNVKREDIVSYTKRLRRQHFID